jgi:ribosome-associated translation inhibitor RaiA
MQLHVRGKNVDVPAGLRQHLISKLRGILGRLEQRTHAIWVFLEDVNGPRRGPDKRCRIHLTGMGGSTAIVGAAGSGLFDVVNEAVDQLWRVLERRSERRRVKPRRRALRAVEGTAAVQRHRGASFHLGRIAGPGRHGQAERPEVHARRGDSRGELARVHDRKGRSERLTARHARRGPEAHQAQLPAGQHGPVRRGGVGHGRRRTRIDVSRRDVARFAASRASPGTGSPRATVPEGRTWRWPASPASVPHSRLLLAASAIWPPPPRPRGAGEPRRGRARWSGKRRRTALRRARG